MLNETTGVIYVDCRMADGTTRRIKMSSQNEGTLTIGEYTYNGTKDVVIPVYKGSLD